MVEKVSKDEATWVIVETVTQKVVSKMHVGHRRPPRQTGEQRASSKCGKRCLHVCTSVVFSTIGIGVLLVAYILCGAFMFKSLEGNGKLLITFNNMFFSIKAQDWWCNFLLFFFSFSFSLHFEKFKLMLTNIWHQMTTGQEVTLWA